MSNLRWSDDVSAVVDENDTIVYVVSAEVGAMIVGYQQAKALADQRHELLCQRNTQIGVLQNRVAAMQDTINRQRAELAEATTLLEQADKRITELERQLAVTLTTIEAAAWCGQCNLPAEHCRENHDGALYAKGCAL